MKITEVEIIQALQWPFVRIHTDAGISGIGEASLQQKELRLEPRSKLIGPISLARIHSTSNISGTPFTGRWSGLAGR